MCPTKPHQRLLDAFQLMQLSSSSVHPTVLQH